ncbi:SRPBCC domain-containing protein [Kitasatospora sp. CB02891]|uniref:SRPBCC domain-containing protein n=1 Tax=Kitasatospora sp. CB02891 TaxID=2020329 RepID=UPI000C270F74|nr:SRPBCC domain-containing protein [Kitasatospora sp. CB02891]PJN29393.1 polyketide cyclase [Kitasatospora sp. CB02891]
MSLFTCEVSAEAEFPGSPEGVWQLITDHARYPQWHPVVVRVEGELAVGARQTEVVRTASGRELTFHPVLTVVDPGRELSRAGRLPVPGLLDNAHSYLITDLGDGRVRVVQRERFTGLLALFLHGRTARDTEARFAAALGNLAGLAALAG